MFPCFKIWKFTSHGSSSNNSAWTFSQFRTPKRILVFCNENEKVSKQLLKKLKVFTKEKYDFRNVWKTKKVRQLFPLKEKNPYPSCKIYEGVCSCKENYIGKIERNLITRWNQHENRNKGSEPAKNLFQNPDHLFQWKVLMSAPMNNHKVKKLNKIAFNCRVLTIIIPNRTVFKISPKLSSW